MKVSEKLRIAICDDESESRAIIHAYLLQMLARQIDDVEIMLFKDSRSLLDNYPKDLDILFLDIMMDTINGMDAAKQIRITDRRVQIVFVTNMPQFAIEGYKVHAFGYLLKPLSYESFQMELWELVQQTFAEKKQGLIIKDNVSTRKLKFSDILYIETNGRKLLIHTAAKEYVYKSTMSELESTLLIHGFIRCHHAYLVNAAHVSAITSTDIELTNGERIPVSRNKRAFCMKVLGNYIGAKI